MGLAAPFGDQDTLEVRLEGQKVIAEIAGKQVGSLRFFHNRFHYHPRIYSVSFADFVSGSDTTLIARKLYDCLVKELQPHNPLLLRTGIDEDDPFYTVLRALGFRDYRRVYNPVLEVTAVNLESLKTNATTFAALGYEIVRLSDLDWTTEVAAKLYALHTDVYSDTSTVVPATPERFSQAEWLAATVKDDAVIPEAFFIAVQDGEFVGFGNLFRGEIEGELETGTFGTRRSYRHHHREIMLALKAQEIAYAKRHNHKMIRAEIDAENPLILQICAELPFMQGKDYISMVKVMNWTVAP